MELLILQTPTSSQDTNCSLQALLPKLVLILLQFISQIKYQIFISTPAGLKSKFLTNSIPVKAYVVFHKLKPTTFLHNSIFF